MVIAKLARILIRWPVIFLIFLLQCCSQRNDFGRYTMPPRALFFGYGKRGLNNEMSDRLRMKQELAQMKVG